VDDRGLFEGDEAVLAELGDVEVGLSGHGLFDLLDGDGAPPKLGPEGLAERGVVGGIDAEDELAVV
jgi:hypothetical protein